MAYFLLEPEPVCTRHASTDCTTRSPGDELLESFPCFLLSRRLGERAAAEGLTGFELADVEVTLSPEAEELLADVQLPEFRWLKVTGVAGSADFGLTAKAQLVVSQRALATEGIELGEDAAADRPAGASVAVPGPGRRE